MGDPKETTPPSNIPKDRDAALEPKKPFLPGGNVVEGLPKKLFDTPLTVWD